ncbi:TolB family protein [Rugamonas rivuli]|nr:PD40 domain-containing protein [Rugamonas rivuli]
MGSPPPVGGESYYVYDRIGNKTEVLPMTNSNRMSRAVPAAISADGHYLAYRTYDPTSPLTASIYLRDMVNHTTQVTKAKSAMSSSSIADQMTFSADGRYIAYSGRVSVSAALIDTFVYDAATGVSEQVNVGPNGAPVRNATQAYSASMSADGGAVVFVSPDAGLTSPAAPAGLGAYVRDRLAGKTEFVSGATKGRVLSASISANGRYVSFTADPAPGFERAMYVYDRLTKKSRIVPGVFAGFTAATGTPRLSADGRYVAFASQNSSTGARSIGLADLGVAAGLKITSAALSLTEGGAAGTYTIALAQVPNASVNVSVTPDQQLSVARTQLVFTPDNWNVPQVVSVQALQDGVAEGKHSGVITHTVTSTDIDYTVVKPASVTVAITDAVVPTVVLPGATWNQSELPVSGTAAPGANVLLTATNRSTGWLTSVSVLADAQGNWSRTLSGLSDGVIEIDAQADGIHSAVQSITVALLPPPPISLPPAQQ